MDTFSKSYVLKFPPELVFAKWVTEDTVVSPAEKMEIEPRVGGGMEGVFSEFSENERVIYSWNCGGSDETTELDVTFQVHADRTEVNVTHSGFRSEESLEMHASGWDSYLEGFNAHIGNSG